MKKMPNWLLAIILLGCDRSAYKNMFDDPSEEEEIPVEEECHLAGDDLNCGNGKIDIGEECDDGNDSYEDDCSPECVLTEPFAEFDAHIKSILTTYNVPGASLGVVKNGRLVWVRAYGEASPGQAMNSCHMGRIASLSKSVTSAAILTLVENGDLDLDEAAFDRLPHLEPSAGDADRRLSDITIRQLLTHQGGWDRSISGDPMFMSTSIASSLGVDAPASAENIIRWMREQPLDFTPGTGYAYSNFGYAVLGRIIETISGLSYEEYVQQDVLDAAGIDRMEIGRTKPELRSIDEMHYYTYEGLSEATSVFDGSSVPWPDGGFYLEAMDAHGGWIASATDTLRFLTAVDGRENRADILNQTSIDEMVAQPDISSGTSWYGFGWSVRPSGGDQNWWHTGSLPGSMSLMVRSRTEFSWAIIVNTRPQDNDGFMSDIDRGMWDAIDKVTAWSEEIDLFTRLP